MRSRPTWNAWLQQHGAAGLITVGDALGESPWQPTDADRAVAWHLYTELRTRIATQPLHYRAGDEETALDSLFKLFGITRDAIRNGGPDCRHTATIATSVMNARVRPLTARWHRLKLQDRLLNDDDRRAFRRDLTRLRADLVVYCRVLAEVAGDADGLVDADGCAGPDADVGPADLGPDLHFDGRGMSPAMYAAELAAIRARRGGPGDVRNLCGLACSGGGIRSATFCLGVLQALHRRGVLPAVDYLSTVSGGGYTGAFLSSYLNDRDQDLVGLETAKLPFHEPRSAEPQPLRALRNNSKFLLKGGAVGRARVAGLLLYGILVNLLALLPVLFVALTIAKLVEQAGFGSALGADGAMSAVWGLLAVLGVAALGLPLAYRHWAKERERVARYERATLSLGLATLALWLLGVVLPRLYDGLAALLGSPQAVVGGFVALPFVLAGAAFALGPQRAVGRVLIVLAGIAGPLLLVVAFFALNDAVAAGWPAIGGLLLVTAGLLAWLRFVDVNDISLHRFYRNRLAETYLLRRSRGRTAAVDPQPLSGLRADNPRAPYHLVNAAVNLPGSRDPELRGRRADFFLFTQDYCGSPLLAYCPTKTMEAKAPNLDLGTAMAISGAAASSFMGTKTIPGLAFWLSLLNVRLAYWLPNPRRVEQLPDGAGVRPLALWRELFGRLDERGDFVNVSDGGHIENLGVYELLRRRCKFVIAIDAEADPRMAFGSLMRLIRYARIDLGVDVSIDLADLSPNRAGHCKAHFALGEIDYGDGARGYLLYVKSSLTGNERDYILDYRHRHPAFPHETTADQFFDEDQFEAYRALGEHVGADLFHEELWPTGWPDQELPADRMLSAWFGRLAANLLPQAAADRGAKAP